MRSCVLAYLSRNKYVSDRHCVTCRKKPSIRAVFSRDRENVDDVRVSVQQKSEVYT